MEILFTHRETTELIRQRTGKDVDLMMIDHKSIQVILNRKILFVRPKVDVVIDKTIGYDVYIHYKAHTAGIVFGNELIHSWILNNLSYIDVPEKGVAIVHLDKIPQLQGMLEKVILRSISFENDSISVYLGLK